MTCELLADEYGLYALGISEGPELSALREHLADGCPVCVPGVREAAAIVVGLSATVRLVDPPARLRRRITGMLADAPSSKPAAAGWWPLGIAAAFALVALFAVSSPRRPSRSEEALVFLRAGDVRQMVIQQPDSHARIFSSASRGVLLLASNFGPAPAGRTYELWLIARDAAPAPAGLFAPKGDGSVVYLAKPLGQPLSAVAVTVEPQTGSDHPTTKPFLVATP